MKYYKYDNGFGKQPNNIIPSYATEITEEEYLELQTAFEAKQKAIADYVEKVKAGEITLEEVPEEYRAEVEVIINAPEPEEPEQLYTLDEAAAIIASEVAGDE